MKFKTILAATLALSYFTAPVYANNGGGDKKKAKTTQENNGDEQKAPKNWFNLDPDEDNVRGVSTERAYKELLAGQESKKTIIVAVVDGGVDLYHEDLKGKIWVNEDEIAGNGKDDDNNGYIDDVHGWNFCGGSDGSNVNYDNLEMTRIYVKGKSKFEGKEASQISSADKKEFDQWTRAKETWEGRATEAKAMYERLGQIIGELKEGQAMAESILGKSDFTMEELSGINSTNKDTASVIETFIKYKGNGMSVERMQGGLDYYDGLANKMLNPGFDPRGIVGDNYDNLSEKGYGNGDIKGPDAGHGTHVAGIIAANRKNELGMKGIAENVKIMGIRAVPNGDERDKDVANSIYYAVDNGAHIINMSFGKDFSPQSEAVAKAFAYAVEKGVLLVHAAGNDNKNIDENHNYPTRQYDGHKAFKTWIEVGASTWMKDDNAMVAGFSNYGNKKVDVFAPGYDIYSTTPENNYDSYNGTSMACPVVSGVAACVWSYYPNLSAKKLRKILLKSTRKYEDTMVDGPGDVADIKFGELSSTGGVINLYTALKLAKKKS